MENSIINKVYRYVSGITTVTLFMSYDTVRIRNNGKRMAKKEFFVDGSIPSRI